MSQGFKKYYDAYNYAVDRARSMRDNGLQESQCEMGLEYSPWSEEYVVFALPMPHNRFGHELRCEVVKPSDPKLGTKENEHAISRLSN